MKCEKSKRSRGLDQRAGLAGVIARHIRGGPSAGRGFRCRLFLIASRRGVDRGRGLLAYGQIAILNPAAVAVQTLQGMLGVENDGGPGLVSMSPVSPIWPRTRRRKACG